MLCPNTQTLFGSNSREGLLLSGIQTKGHKPRYTKVIFNQLFSDINSDHKIQLIMSPESTSEPNLAYIEVTCSVESINYVYDKYSPV